jgi:hypothetical protein
MMQPYNEKKYMWEEKKKVVIYLLATCYNSRNADVQGILRVF